MRRVLISAGEPSGDRHGASVVRALAAAHPEVEIDAVGGPAMRAAGARLLHPIERLSAVGLAEIVRAVPTHAVLLGRLRGLLRSRRYDLVILIDYPGFHLRLAAAAARRRIPVLYYIAPQVWAWGAWRLPALRRSVRQLAVIFPFEERYFAQRGVPATFVGHPLLDAPSPPTRAAARRRLGIGQEVPLLALAPGSRPAEVHRLWPSFRAAAVELRTRRPELRVAVAGSGALQYPGAEEFVIRRDDAATVYAAADAGLCKSGTTTLEAALADLPIAVAYRVHPVTFAVARRLVGVDHVGLVNLLAGRAAVPELLQGAVDPHRLASTLVPLLDRDGPAAREQRRTFAAVREALGRPGAALRVAELAMRLAA